mmetsp:Transcript_29169/g.78277  ORF Transcript_29169/g.78277 Transcript_29169/m.78277 type:complete len:218 (+) Transcript_29169:1493-2146(+)
MMASILRPGRLVLVLDRRGGTALRELTVVEMAREPGHDLRGRLRGDLAPTARQVCLRGASIRRARSAVPRFSPPASLCHPAALHTPLGVFPVELDDGDLGVEVLVGARAVVHIIPRTERAPLVALQGLRRPSLARTVGVGRKRTDRPRRASRRARSARHVTRRCRWSATARRLRVLGAGERGGDATRAAPTNHHCRSCRVELTGTATLQDERRVEPT